MAYYLFDPVSAIALTSAVSSVGQGIQQQQAYESAADDVKAQEKASALQYARDRKDAQENTDAAVARRRALLAASGAAGTAQGTELLSAVAATGGQNLSRMATDYQIERSSLRARRANLKAAGQKALFSSFTKAGLSAAGAFGGGAAPYGGTGNGMMIKGSNGMLGGGV